MKLRFFGVLAIVLLAAVGPAAAQIPIPPGWQAERAVVLVRDGVYAPLQTELDSNVATPWPVWPVQPGFLTPHGAELMRLMGGYYRALQEFDAFLPRLQQKLEGRQGAFTYGGRRKATALLDPEDREWTPVFHPIVRTHPVLQEWRAARHALARGSKGRSQGPSAARSRAADIPLSPGWLAQNHVA